MSIDKGDKPWKCGYCGAYHFYDTWKECQYCGVVRGEKEEKTNEWKVKEALGREGCASVWPKIVWLRAELKTYTDVHGYFEAMRIEAGRHLVKLPIDETEQGKTDKLYRVVTGMTKEQRNRLANLLEKTVILKGGD